MVLKKSRNSGNFKSKNIKVKGYYSILLFLMLIFLDRMTKIWAMLNLEESKDFGIMAFTYVLNTGAGFSIMEDMNFLLIVVALIALTAIVYYKRDIPKFSLVLLAAGIVGNLIDRIAYGGVIDFINLKFWPIFNFADSMICIGVVYWIILIIRDDKHPSTSEDIKIIKKKIKSNKR
jgi:signal peptidase II